MKSLECVGGPMDGDTLSYADHDDRVFYLGRERGTYTAACLSAVPPKYAPHVRGIYFRCTGSATTRWFP